MLEVFQHYENVIIEQKKLKLDTDITKYHENDNCVNVKAQIIRKSSRMFSSFNNQQAMRISVFNTSHCHYVSANY